MSHLPLHSRSIIPFRSAPFTVQVCELRDLIAKVIGASRTGQHRLEATLQKVLAESSTSSVIEKSMLRLMPFQQTAQNDDSDEESG